jgi:hypothetical protein
MKRHDFSTTFFFLSPSLGASRTPRTRRLKTGIEVGEEEQDDGDGERAWHEQHLAAVPLGQEGGGRQRTWAFHVQCVTGKQRET